MIKSRPRKNRKPILTANGTVYRPPTQGSRFFEAANQGRRMSTWGISTAGPNSVLSGDYKVLRSRSREAIRNNPLARNAAEAWVSSLIGTGVRPRWILEDKDLKAKIQNLWKAWIKVADTTGANDYYGLQYLAAMGEFESGESLARYRPRNRRDNLPVPLQLQLLEPDHLDGVNPQAVRSGNMIRYGIEFDSLGRRIFYHLTKAHPGDNSAMSGTGGGAGSIVSVPVPASEVIHVFDPRRPGQVRGIPRLTPVLVMLHELDKYLDASVVRMQVAAMFAAFITTTETDFDFDVTDAEGETTDENSNELQPMEPGATISLAPGEQVSFSDPPEIGSSFEPFMKTVLRMIAAGIGVTYEQLTGDLEKVNYSSIRAGLVEFRRRCEAFQRRFVHQFCQPVVEHFMDAAVLSGALEIPDYLENRERYVAVRHIAQGFPWVDPLKDGKADIAAIDAGLTSRTEVIISSGRDPEEVDAQRAEDEEREREYGLASTSATAAAIPDPNEATENDQGVQAA